MLLFFCFVCGFFAGGATLIVWSLAAIASQDK